MHEMFVSFFSSGIWALIKAVLLLLLAFITATVVKSLVVKLFTKTKLNTLLKQADNANGKERSVDFIGKLVHLLVFLLFVPGIFESLGMREVSSPILNLLNTLWGYLPNLLAAVLVLWVGFFIARLHTVFAMVSKIAIYTIGIFMVLNELSIAKEIVNTAFILLIAALAISFAISFGIGGRTFAEKVLKKLSDTCGLEREGKIK